MTHSRRSFSPIRSVRRKTTWAGGPEGPLGLISSTGGVAFPTGVAISGDGLTLVRVRGEVLLSLASATLAGGFTYAVGMCMVTDAQFSVGISAFEHPLTGDAWDGWFYHTTGQLIATTSATPAEWKTDNVVARIPIDSKAMRKMKDTDVMVAVFEGAESGTATMRGFIRTRLLFKIP